MKQMQKGVSRTRLTPFCFWSFLIYTGKYHDKQRVRSDVLYD